MSAGILIVGGGRDLARARFAGSAEADWSQGIGVALEKYGVLGFSSISPETFAANGFRVDAGCVLVCDLPEDAWSERFLDRLLGCGRPVLCGGPVPARVRVHAGIATAAPAERGGSVVAASKSLRLRGLAYGYAPGGALEGDRTRPVPRDPALDWTRLDVPIGDRQARAWRAQLEPGEAWTALPGAEVLAEWVGPGTPALRRPAIVRRERVAACSFPLFALIARAHSSRPWASGEFRSSLRVAGLETLLLALVDEMHATAGAVRPRVLPWPRGARWALSVRHDFDRPLTPVRVQPVLEGHARAGTRATWYWRSRHLRRPRRWRRSSPGEAALRLVAGTPGHEVAHHTEQLWAGAERERALIEAVSGTPVLGTSAHGDKRCFRFQGAPNLLWAEQEGMRYTELIEQAHLLPHRFLALRGEGAVEPSSLICLPHHTSLDISVRTTDTRATQILDMVPIYRNTGGLLQIMNHPDINVAALFELLEAIPRAGRFDCTAGEATDWWARTHSADELRIVPLGDDGFELHSVRGVRDLVVELLTPYGERQVRLVQLEPGVPGILRSARERAVR